MSTLCYSQRIKINVTHHTNNDVYFELCSICGLNWSITQFNINSGEIEQIGRVSYNHPHFSVEIYSNQLSIIQFELLTSSLNKIKHYVSDGEIYDK